MDNEVVGRSQPKAVVSGSVFRWRLVMSGVPRRPPGMSQPGVSVPEADF